ncbi:hypothetical protein ACFVU2_19195 [Leifsonia sp. NPDC058194]|uniref:hypothetical protein n=1 Tax=Leifsonia sp. NPDC058194 TaxID=3346374 RepID=UPI0036DA033A
MAQRDAAAVHLTDATAPTLAVGDRVLIKRNLDHPVWKKRVEGEYGTSYVPDPDVVEEIGVGRIIDTFRRSVHQVAPQGGLATTYKLEVRADSGFWYDAETGLQLNSSATTITKLDEHDEHDMKVARLREKLAESKA